MTNGPSSPLRLNQEDRDRKERDNLFAAIETSNRGRQAIDFDDSKADKGAQGIVNGEIDVEGYNQGTVAKTPLSTSRAHSPYTQHPTIDFDGLSWPST